MTQRMRARRAAEDAAKKEEEERAKKKLDDEVKAKARHDNPFIPALPLVAAVLENNVALAKELIWATPIDGRLEYVNGYDKDGQTALFHAMGPDHLPMMQLLLDYGADPNARNDNRNTSLHAACVAQNKKVNTSTTKPNAINHSSYICVLAIIGHSSVDLSWCRSARPELRIQPSASTARWSRPTSSIPDVPERVSVGDDRSREREEMAFVQSTAAMLLSLHVRYP